MSLLDPYENHEIYMQVTRDDNYEDVIDESYEPEARRILAIIQQRKKNRKASDVVVWLKEGF